MEAPVATMTAQSGCRPLCRHLMLKNFSAPMSAPKPACKVWEVLLTLTFECCSMQEANGAGIAPLPDKTFMTYSLKKNCPTCFISSWVDNVEFNQKSAHIIRPSSR